MLRLTAFLIVALTWFIPILPAISQIDIQKITSPQGIQAWFLPEPHLNIVSMTFSFQGGAAYTPSQQRGIAVLLASLLMEGTEKRTNSELKDYLLDHGIELSFTASQDRFVVNLRTTTDNLANAVSLIREIIHTPRFNEDDLQRLVTAQKIALEHQLKQPEAQAAFAHRQMIMANHPYTFFTKGTVEGLSNITTADLKAYLRKIMTRNSLIIGICGRIDPKKLGNILDELFVDLPAKSLLAQLPTPIGDFQAQTQLLSSSNPQAIVLFSQNGLGHSDPDFIKLNLLNHIIGEGMTSRLWQTIREKNGLAYAVGTNLVNLDKIKLMMGNLGADPANVQQAIDTIKKIWQDVRKNGITESELAHAKSYLIGIFPLMFSSSVQTALALHDYQVYGLDQQYFKNRTKIITDITLQQVNDFAKKFINPEHLMITVIEKPTETDRSNTHTQQHGEPIQHTENKE